MTSGGRVRGRTRVKRVAIVALVLLVWLAIFLVGGRTFSQLNELGTNDRVQFLPASAESTDVHRAQAAFRAQGFSYAVAVFTFDDELDGHAGQLLTRQIQRIEPIEGVPIFRASPFVIAEDRHAAMTAIPVAAAGEIDEAVYELREELRRVVPEATGVYITGGAGFAADIISAIAGIDGFLLLVALAAVLVILILVHRSALLPLIVVASSLSALCEPCSSSRSSRDRGRSCSPARRRGSSSSSWSAPRPTTRCSTSPARRMALAG